VSKEDGGSAFPAKGGNIFYVPEQHSETVKGEIDRLKQTQDGMTLRDYFAAKAMQGFCANTGHELMDGEHTFKSAARDSYKIADAMLRARKP
jgi:hypothetical protein